MKAFTILSTFAVLVTQSAGNLVTIVNHCDFELDLYDNVNGVPVAVGATYERHLPDGWSGIMRHGRSPQATLAEMTIVDGKFWYDISIIPTGNGVGPGFCPSLHECERVTGGTGFNVPMQMAPQSNINGAHCRVATCLANGCEDAYQFPKDDTKTRNCPAGTPMKITFCPGGPGGQTPAPTTEAPTPAPTPEPTPEPTPSQTEVEEESLPDDDSTEGSISSEASKASSNSTDSSFVEDRSLPDEVSEVPTTVESPASTPEADEEKPSTDDAEENTEDLNNESVEANTKSTGTGGAVGYVVMTLFGVAAAVGVAVVVAVRRKKNQLDEANTKTPAHMDVI